MTALRESAIEFATIFVTRCIQETSERDREFWWKDDALLALKAIKQQLAMLAQVENLNYALALTDSICRLADAAGDYCCGSANAGLCIVMEELQARLAHDYEVEKREREERLKPVPLRKHVKRKVA